MFVFVFKTLSLRQEFFPSPVSPFYMRFPNVLTSVQGMEVAFAPFGQNLTLYILLVYKGFLYTLFLKDLFRFIGQLSTSFADG